MKAVSIDKITLGNEVKLTDIPLPSVKPGWVLIKIKAFGMNHSEQILRSGEIEANYIQKPVIPGIECTGIIEDPSDSNFNKGQKVIALMGGMGRSFNGSYAEYALLPVHHVFTVDSDLSWAQLAAIPETYFTAWGSLINALHIKQEDILLIRGGTCALGYASIQIAKAMGCKVIATTHRETKLELIAEADEAVLDTGHLADTLKGITKVLELVGPSTLFDSMHCISKEGIVCSTGILGGVFSIAQFNPIQDIPNGVYLTGFHSNWPERNTIDAIMTFIKVNKLKPKIGAIYAFKDIQSACMDMDAGKINGKIVIEVNKDEL